MEENKKLLKKVDEKDELIDRLENSYNTLKRNLKDQIFDNPK